MWCLSSSNDTSLLKYELQCSLKAVINPRPFEAVVPVNVRAVLSRRSRAPLHVHFKLLSEVASNAALFTA